MPFPLTERVCAPRRIPIWVVMFHSSGAPFCRPPVSPCPPPLPPTDSVSALTAYATANPVISYVTSYAIPFGSAQASAGYAIAHATDTPDFVITESGEYLVEYKTTADNPAVAAGNKIDQSIELVSGMSGVLDMYHFTEKKQTISKKLIVNLQAGDRIYLRATQPLPAEMHFSDTAISITKMR